MRWLVSSAAIASCESLSGFEPFRIKVSDCSQIGLWQAQNNAPRACNLGGVMFRVSLVIEGHRQGLEIAPAWRGVKLRVERGQSRRTLGHPCPGSLRSRSGSAAESGGAGGYAESQKGDAAVRTVLHGQTPS